MMPIGIWSKIFLNNLVTNMATKIDKAKTHYVVINDKGVYYNFERDEYSSDIYTAQMWKTEKAAQKVADRWGSKATPKSINRVVPVTVETKITVAQ